MSEATRKANNILSVLETEGDPDDLDHQMENLEACLRAAATIHLKIQNIEPWRNKVTLLMREANNAMDSLVTAWKENQMDEMTRKTNNILIALRTEGDRDSLATDLEDIEACLRSAIILDAAIRGIDYKKIDMRHLCSEVHKLIRSRLTEQQNAGAERHDL